MTKISSARLDMEQGRVDNAILKKYGETLVGGAAGTIAGSAYTVDLSSGNVFHLILNQTCTFTFSTPVPAGTASSFTLILRQDEQGGRTATWPSSVAWSGGTAPTLTTPGGFTDILSFTTIDGGASWVGFAGADAYHTSLSNASAWFVWGDNSNGQIGDKLALDRSSPVQLASAYNWSVIASGSCTPSGPLHSAGIKSNGTLWTWGNNASGQLGDNAALDLSSPVQIGTATDWTSVAVGLSHTLGIRGGNLFVWGLGTSGQIGNGLALTRSSPTQIASDRTWSNSRNAVAAGSNFSLAIDSAGHLFAWGLGTTGQLGTGLAATTSSPVQIGTATSWTSVSCGAVFSLALQTNNLFTWGNGTNGQLGNNVAVARSSPVQVITGVVWSKVVAGGYHTLGIDTSQNLWAWGNGAQGQLGFPAPGGSAVSRSSPVQVTIGSTTWTDVAAGMEHSVATSTGGKLWAWGLGTNGQLGVGTATTRSSPTQIGSGTAWTFVATTALTSFASQ